MFQTERSTTPNSYLIKYKQNKKIRNSKDKENSILSTNKDTSYTTNDESISQSDQLERYKSENKMLKQILFNQKFDMKSQLEFALNDQKQNFQQIIDQYQKFIEQLIHDKKDLQCQKEEQIVKMNEMQNQMKQLNLQILNQQNIIKSNINVNINDQSHQSNEIKSQNEKIQIQSDFEEYKIMMQQTLSIKDQCINQLNQILNQTIFMEFY